MLAIFGGPARSAFRLRKLLAATSDQGVTGLAAHHVHLVDGVVEDQSVLRALLDYGAEPAPSLKPRVDALVTPRPGTLSPWSSKATDIAHNAGLRSIRRIERGVAWTIDGTQASIIAPLLHDRMVEAVLPSVESAKVLFGRDVPRPLRHVPVLAEGRDALVASQHSPGGLASSADL